MWMTRRLHPETVTVVAVLAASLIFKNLMSRGAGRAILFGWPIPFVRVVSYAESIYSPLSLVANVFIGGMLLLLTGVSFEVCFRDRTHPWQFSLRGMFALVIFVSILLWMLVPGSGR